MLFVLLCSLTLKTKTGFLAGRFLYICLSVCMVSFGKFICTTSLACGLTIVTYVLADVGELLILFASIIGAVGFSPIRHILSVQICSLPPNYCAQYTVTEMIFLVLS